MINIIETGLGGLIIGFDRDDTWYQARVIQDQPDYVKVEILESSGRESFRSWGENRDGVINLAKRSIRRSKP
ncbi:hypothetical protein HY385_01225 [Candidatus Daviesbacteria bacterium]|nr:hypothetical protein [Candidatus Daviesbacteria bacterium]